MTKQFLSPLKDRKNVLSGAEIFIDPGQAKELGDEFKRSVGILKDYYLGRAFSLPKLEKALGDDPWPFLQKSMTDTYRRLNLPVRLDLVMRNGNYEMVGVEAEDIWTPCEVSDQISAWAEDLDSSAYTVSHYPSAMISEVARYLSMNLRKNGEICIVYDYTSPKAHRRAQVLSTYLGSVKMTSKVITLDKTSEVFLKDSTLALLTNPWADLMSLEGGRGQAWKERFKDPSKYTLSAPWAAGLSEIPMGRPKIGEQVFHAWVDIDNPARASLLCASNYSEEDAVMTPVVVCP